MQQQEKIQMDTKSHSESKQIPGVSKCLLDILNTNTGGYINICTLPSGYQYIIATYIQCTRIQQQYRYYFSTPWPYTST